MLQHAPVRITDRIQRIPLLAQFKQLYIEPMEGGASNRTYHVRADNGEEFTVRFDTPNRDIFARSRTDEFEILRLLAPYNVGPEPIEYDKDNGVTVFRYVPGKPVQLEDVSSRQFREAMLHFFQKCYALKCQTKPLHLAYLLQTYWRALSPEKQPLYARLYRIDRHVRPLVFAINSLRHEFRTCHMDLTPGNLLWHNGKIIAVDWEYAAFFHPMVDLAIFANNWSLTNEQLRPMVPDNCVVRWQVFDEVRLLAAYLEAIWYAVRATLEPHESQWQEMTEMHLARVESGLADLYPPNAQ